MTAMIPRITRPLLAVFLISPTGVGAADTLHLDAETAAQLAIDASPQVAAADARRSGAQFALESADAARMPIVTASAAVSQRSAVPEFSAPISGPGNPPQVIFPNIETTYLGDLSLTQPLYTGGAISAGREAARHDLAAADHSRGATVVDLRYQARTAYWQAVAADAALHSAEAQEARARRLHEDARAMRAAGMAVDADVLGAEARAQGAQVDVVRARADREDALASLRSLLGLAPDAAVDLADSETRSVPAGPAPLDALTREAMENRPDLQAAAAHVAALEARARAVDASRKPSVGLAAAWDLARPNQRYLPLEDEWNDSWSVGVMATWTLFDGDRVRSNAAAFRAERDATADDRAELVRQVLLAVESARLWMQAALDAVPAADASRKAAEAREQASRERYAAGLAPIQEMLDAQADLADAELEQIRTRAGAWIAEAGLDRAVGR